MTVYKALLAAVSLTALAAPAQAATTYNFKFDNQGLVFFGSDGPLIGPIVGTGTFTSPVDLAAGTYNLTDLAGFTMNFSFIDGMSFDQTHIATPLTGAAVRITDVGGGVQRLFFTESGGAGSNGGPSSGALDLVNVLPYLSFEPSFSGGNFLYFTEDFAGRYLALSGAVPEPGTWALMILGFGLVGGALRRQKQQVRVSYAAID